MDPIALSAVLLAVVTGASEALGGQLLSGLAALIRRPWHRQAAEPEQAAPEQAAPEQAALPSGEAELAALRVSPDDQRKALRLAEVLLARSEADAEFGRGLRNWWVQAGPLRDSTGDVANTISGCTQHGPVLQGRDFGTITFGAPPPPDPGS
jgi:hypothetical protein